MGKQGQLHIFMADIENTSQADKDDAGVEFMHQASKSHNLFLQQYGMLLLLIFFILKYKTPNMREVIMLKIFEMLKI